LGYGWLGRFRLGLVGLVHGMQQLRSLCACFGYRCDSCELEALDYYG
jgi:hypothetical protein